MLSHTSALDIVNCALAFKPISRERGERGFRFLAPSPATPRKASQQYQYPRVACDLEARANRLVPAAASLRALVKRAEQTGGSRASTPSTFVSGSALEPSRHLPESETMDVLGKRERRRCHVKSFLKRNWLLIATVASVILGKNLVSSMYRVCINAGIDSPPPTLSPIQS